MLQQKLKLHIKPYMFNANIKSSFKTMHKFHISSWNLMHSLSFTQLTTELLSPKCNHYRFSLSHDDCSSSMRCCCRFVITASAAAVSKPRIFSTYADCLRWMMLRGVLEPCGAAKLRGDSGDLWLTELDWNNLLLAGLTAYMFLDIFSTAVSKTMQFIWVSES